MFNKSTTYIIKGLNFKKFIAQLTSNNIEVAELVRLEYNLFEISIDNKYQKSFLNLTKQFNYEVSEKTLSTKQNLRRVIKSNFIFVIIGLILCISLAFLSNFVINIEVIGLENITKDEVLTTLYNNGYPKYKLKSFYDLDSIEKVLTSNIDKISYASSIIKGNTLIVNINEKIDNSEYVYDYSPIIAPFDCIIKKINLVSGQIFKDIGSTAKVGDVIVAPCKIFGENQVKVPAKAEVEAYVEFCQEYFATKDISDENKNKLIEEYKKKVYNKLSGYKILEDFTLNVMEKVEENRLLLYFTFAGCIAF